MAFQGLAPVLFESVSQTTATNSVELGTRAVVDGNAYCYVYNGGNSQVSIGEGVITSGLSGYTVTVSSTTMVDAFLGVCNHATIATGYYGWVMTKGYANVKTPADSSIASGDILVAGGDGRWTVNSVVTNAVAPFIQGRCVGATGSAGVGRAFVSLLG